MATRFKLMFLRSVTLINITPPGLRVRTECRSVGLKNNTGASAVRKQLNRMSLSYELRPMTWCVDHISRWARSASTARFSIMMTKQAKRELNDPGLDRILRAAAICLTGKSCFTRLA